MLRSFTAALVLSLTTAQEQIPVPTECVGYSAFVNEAASTEAVVTDLSQMTKIGLDATVISMKACADATKVTGVQLSKGVISDMGISNVVALETHGSLAGTGLKCTSLTFPKGKNVSSMIIYNTDTTIVSLMVVQEDKTITSIGPNPTATTANSGMITFNSETGVEAFYGFQSKSLQSTLTSLGVIKYDNTCLTSYIKKA